MAVVGRTLLVLALLSCLYGIGASLYGARAGGLAWVDSGRRAMYVVAGLAVFAFAILDVAFVRSDFSYNIVASGSSTTTPLFYRAAAIWSTQQGSLLLWVMLISCWSSLALFITRRRVREIVPYAQARAVHAWPRSSSPCRCSSPTRSRPARTRRARVPASIRCCATRR